MKMTIIATLALLSASVTAQTGPKYLNYCKGVSQDLGKSLCRKHHGTWGQRTDVPPGYVSRSGYYCLGNGWWGEDPCPREYGNGFEVVSM
ncbi:hypothetical protein VDGL01_12583 [Verticillium dahliae]